MIGGVLALRSLDDFRHHARKGEALGDRALCETITPAPDKAWTAEYIKMCSTDRFELETWAHSRGRRLKACEFCDP